MNCSDVQEALSAYHDGELPDVTRSRITSHLRQCPKCAQSLAAFEQLSAMATRLKTPTLPPRMWDQIAGQLDESAIRMASKSTERSVSRLVLVAATILVAIGIGWLATVTQREHREHHEFAAEFAHYLNEFQRDPDAAQRLLIAKYAGQNLQADQIVQRVGYRPVVARGVPAGFSVQSTHVLTMPCCRCVQSVCRRSDGSVVTVFEHDDDEPEWFGDRPVTTTECGGKTCNLVEIDGRIAASWRQGSRNITLIGARNVEEIDQFALAFNE